MNEKLIEQSSPPRVIRLQGPPVWLDYLFQEPSLLWEYKVYLHSLLELRREELEMADDVTRTMRAKGAIASLKEQILFVENAEIEKFPRKPNS